ncbi:hypothetical protein [Bosea sp. (in: a-proteobacteria)]|jgi:hypothetical protein|uniref:hypothetical protein n=1 Tax=Bosea sp. (in: a-proteobacteria) TaxID=1871050 RepID=UPI002DDD9958|nr:hypothetical protein [Bosea sp. (in: a-proteobacteria)]HEV2510345.1 hypothetical protein [Bosea sp. (in: a-proteobacteria)]
MADDEKASEDAAKKAAERALIHEHAFQFVLASFHQGTPRLKAWTALRLAASIAAIANSQEIDAIKNDLARQPAEKALEAVTQDVRKDEEQRQKDQVAVTTLETAVIDGSLHAANTKMDDKTD